MKMYTPIGVISVGLLTASRHTVVFITLTTAEYAYNFQDIKLAGLSKKNKAGCLRNLLLYVGEY